MDSDLALRLLADTLIAAAKMSAPLLLATLAIGLLVSIVQVVTQIQEMTLTFVPKIIAVFLALLISFPWIMDKMITFTQEIFLNFPQYIK